MCVLFWPSLEMWQKIPGCEPLKQINELIILAQTVWFHWLIYVIAIEMMAFAVCCKVAAK